MTNADFIQVALLSAGATLGMGLLAVAAHIGNRQDDHYLPFGVVCVGGSMVFLSLVALNAATSVPNVILAFKWHVTGGCIALSAFVWLYSRLAPRTETNRVGLVVWSITALLVVVNALSPGSLHFVRIDPAPAGLRLLDGRPALFVGRPGWPTVVFHLWMLLPTWLCFVHGRRLWRAGNRLLGGVAQFSATLFIAANIIGTRADLSGGHSMYAGGMPMLVAVILLIGLALGDGERRQREALQASGDELRRANTRLEAELEQRRKLEARLAQTQRMEALGHMAAGVAHDFNNVLTVAGAHAEMLAARLAPGSTERQGAETIGGAIDRGAGLTRQLLAFARRQTLAPADLDADATLSGMRELLASLVGKQTRLVLGLGAQGRTIVADPTQFAQVVMNLAVNARHAMPEGGQLAITTAWLAAGAPGACACEGALAQPHVLLTVSDSGSGIDPDTLPHIFEPFFTTKGPEEGTGLGLATVHGIVQQSGGQIAVDSRPGAGTTFRICWPATRPHVQPAAPAAQSGASGVL